MLHIGHQLLSACAPAGEAPPEQGTKDFAFEEGPQPLPPPATQPVFPTPTEETTAQSDVTGTEFDTVSGLTIKPAAPAQDQGTTTEPGLPPVQTATQAGTLPDGAL